MEGGARPCELLFSRCCSLIIASICCIIEGAGAAEAPGGTIEAAVENVMVESDELEAG